LSTPKTILVVEDEAPMRKLVVSILRSAGYSVLEAENPAEAAAQFGADLFGVDLLFTDVYMPSMLGPEFARELLSMRPDLKVVFATGSNQDAIAKTMHLVPHERFLQKPYSAEELRQAVKAAFEAP
jgi:CheY-like chemotaxis protein